MNESSTALETMPKSAEGDAIAKNNTQELNTAVFISNASTSSHNVTDNIKEERKTVNEEDFVNNGVLMEVDLEKQLNRQAPVTKDVEKTDLPDIKEQPSVLLPEVNKEVEDIKREEGQDEILPTEKTESPVIKRRRRRKRKALIEPANQPANKIIKRRKRKSPTELANQTAIKTRKQTALERCQETQKKDDAEPPKVSESELKSEQEEVARPDLEKNPDAKPDEGGPQRRQRTRKRWTKEEDESLLSFVKTFGPNYWSLLSKRLSKRTPKQCRDRWFNHINPDIVPEKTWTEEEDAIIMDTVSNYGTQWCQIATLLPGRTVNAIRNRYNILQKYERPDLQKCGNSGKKPADTSPATLSPATSSKATPSTASSSTVTSLTVTPSTATLSTATSSTATSLTATPSTATLSTATSLTATWTKAIPSTATPSTATTSRSQGSTTTPKTTKVDQKKLVPLILERRVAPTKVYSKSHLVVRNIGAVDYRPAVFVPVVESVRQNLLNHLVRLMPDHWVSRVSIEGAYALKWAPGTQCVVQRAVYAPFNGAHLKVIVHAHSLPDQHEVFTNPRLKAAVRLREVTVADFAAVLITALETVEEYKLCPGMHEASHVEEWFKYRDCRLDENIYMEETYSKTLRPLDCEYLIGRERTKCTSCDRYLEDLRRRDYRRFGKDRNRDIAASPEMKERLAKIVATESLPVDRQLARELEGAFNDSSGVVRFLWEEQTKANADKKWPAVKWHPLLLRWALKTKAVSSDGLIKFDHRTLYEYFERGVEDSVVIRMSDRLSRPLDPFLRYHVVVFDEMYRFQNVVYHKATAKITGYVNLDQIGDELAKLEDRVSREEMGPNPASVSTLLTFIVKGVSLENENRGVVAGFEIDEVNVEQVHAKAWHVIEALEVAGVRVIALVGDGGALCQAFFNRQSPVTRTASGVVFDTANSFANNRPLFFLNDTRNLLLLIRNCFANSGAHKKSRNLMKNGESISWQTIVKLAQMEGCEKLKKVHVFLNSHSVAEVSIAAQVMSRAVATSIELNMMDNTTETVKLVRYVNDFYECLNGASERARDDKTAAYRSEEDPRFGQLSQFLEYLEEWKSEVNALPMPKAEKHKRLLSAQTLIGIETTIRSFSAVVKYLLRLPKTTDFQRSILARAFQLK